MKKCINCGVENPDTSLFCMSCGTRFPEVVSDPSYPSRSEAPSPISSPPPSPSYYSKPRVDSSPIREKFGSVLTHSSYNWLVTGSLLFSLSPIISIMFGMVFLETNEYTSQFLFELIGIACFSVFIFGLYSISKIEPRSINRQLDNVPLTFVIFLVLKFIGSTLLTNIQDLPTEPTYDDVSDILNHGLVIVFLVGIGSVFLCYGAFKFTNWFEDFVTMLHAPYNAPTSRLKWFGITSLLGNGLQVLVYLFLQSAIDKLSFSTLETAQTLSQFAVLVLLVSLVLQVVAGYKIYSVLNNIRKGKYDGTYQRLIMNKYDRGY